MGRARRDRGGGLPRVALDPLALALAAGDSELHVRLDERSAGFFAWVWPGHRPAGRGLRDQRHGRGRAAPGVVEAHHAGVPLIVCTADRPPELHDTGAPQTIDQIGLFAPAVRWAAGAGCADGGPGAHLAAPGRRVR